MKARLLYPVSTEMLNRYRQLGAFFSRGCATFLSFTFGVKWRHSWGISAQMALVPKQGVIQTHCCPIAIGGYYGASW
jgi:hypothetical protein